MDKSSSLGVFGFLCFFLITVGLAASVKVVVVVIVIVVIGVVVSDGESEGGTGSGSRGGSGSDGGGVVDRFWSSSEVGEKQVCKSPRIRTVVLYTN